MRISSIFYHHIYRQIEIELRISTIVRLTNQFSNKRKLLYSKMLKKLGLKETTDSKGVKVLSSIEGAERNLPLDETNKLLKRLTVDRKRP